MPFLFTPVYFFVKEVIFLFLSCCGLWLILLGDFEVNGLYCNFGEKYFRYEEVWIFDNYGCRFCVGGL